MKNQRVQVGTVGVDAGLIWVGDPCYVLGEDASHGVKKWSEFCDILDKNGYFDSSVRFTEPLGSDVGLAIESGYGDGVYPVFVTYNFEGRVAKVEVIFDDSADDEDDDDWSGSYYGEDDSYNWDEDYDNSDDL